MLWRLDRCCFGGPPLTSIFLLAYVLHWPFSLRRLASVVACIVSQLAGNGRAAFRRIVSLPPVLILTSLSLLTSGGFCLAF